MLHALLSLTWLIVVWGILGGAIARITMVRVAKMRQAGVAEALRFSVRLALPLVLAPCCPLLGLFFCAVIGAAFGLLYWLPAVGPALAGVMLVLPLGAGLVMTLMAAGLLVGWPLMQAAVAAGSEDALDAMSRTFSYLNQRIGSIAALLLLVWAEGLVGIFLVDLFAGGVIRLTHWSLGLTAPGTHLEALFGASDASAGAFAAQAHAFWLGSVQLLAHAWIYSFFWTAAALLYLWLRHDVDGTPWEEIDARGTSVSPAISTIAAPPAGASPGGPPASL